MKERATRLREAMEKIHIYSQAKRILNSVTVERMIGRPPTEAEKKEGETLFQDWIDKVASAATENGKHPLAQFLEKAGAPDLAVEIIKDLYSSEASRLQNG
jgi:hypothetical protein